jgi:hypothetical protein
MAASGNSAAYSCCDSRRQGAGLSGPASCAPHAQTTGRLAAAAPSRRRDHLQPSRTRGPTREDLAAQFFDGLAQFYRRGNLRWIQGTKRSPELREQRITTMVQLPERGVKDYHDRWDARLLV